MTNCGPCNYNIEVPNPSGYTPPQTWGNCLINMVRVFTNDLGTPPQVDDARMWQIIGAAAFLVYTELGCCGSVAKPLVAGCDGTMSDNPLNYPGFANLVALKSACLLDRGIARAKAQADGIRASCGPALIQVTSSSQSYSALFEYGSCAAYEQLKEDLCFRCPLSSAACCQQVMSIFVSDNYRPSCDTGSCCNRR